MPLRPCLPVSFYSCQKTYSQFIGWTRWISRAKYTAKRAVSASPDNVHSTRTFTQISRLDLCGSGATVGCNSSPRRLFPPSPG